MIRLNKFLAALGFASRRRIDQLLIDGKIKVNGKTAKLGIKVDPARDEIIYNGKKINPAIQPKHLYLILNKPVGVITSASDEQGRTTVLDLVKTQTRLVPVGRLDQFTSGLLLLTNDGELTYRLTHPKFHISKTYRVTYSGNISPRQLHEIQAGILLDDGPTLPAKVENLTPNSFEITITQGKNRQVRRMCQKVGIQLTRLHRLGIGPIKLENLSEGSYRELSPDEVLKLKQFASLQ